VRRFCEQTVALAEQYGDRRRWSDSVNNLMNMAFVRGQFRQALELSEELYASSRSHNLVHFELESLIGQVYSLLELGSLDQAWIGLKRMQELISDQDEIASPHHSMFLYSLGAMLHLRRNEHREALRFAGLAAQRTSAFFPTYFGFLPAYGSAAQVYLSLWESDGLQDRTDVLAWKACKVLIRFGRVFRIGQPRALLLVGLHRWLSGRPGAAHRAWNRSLELGESLDLSYDQGMAHYEIGRHLAVDDPYRHEHLAQAVEIFGKTEADFALKQSRLLLDRG
jgi:hypothetical protein